MLPFILASGSPRRRELLAGLGIAFSVFKPDIDESERPGEDPVAYVRRLSREKADAVAARLTEPSAILAADTTVIFDGRILGKPSTPDEARAMLAALRDTAHTVCTALTLRRTDQPVRVQTEHTLTTVVMRPYSDAEIEAYIASGDPFDKAGGYAIQHAGFAPVARIEGSHSNVVGLPLETLTAMLTDFELLPATGYTAD
jgi:septum formation protein